MCELYVKADPILYESRSRSLRIHGVITTLRLENQFWDILTEMAAGEGLTTFHRAIADRLHHVERGHQFTGCVHGYFKFAARHGLDTFSKDVGRAVDGVERLGEARGQTPFDGRLGNARYKHWWQS